LSIQDELAKLFEALTRRGLKTWHMLVIADMLKESLREIAPKIEVPKPPLPPQPKTSIIDAKNITVKESYDLLNLVGVGHLKELLLISPIPDFSLSLLMDGKALRVNFSDLMEISGELEHIDAYEKDGKYVLRITDLKWVESLLIAIQTSKPIQLERIFANYDILTLQ